jgi:aminoglycoside 6'-N-acetyltransferase
MGAVAVTYARPMRDLHGELVVLREMVRGDAAELRRIHETPEVRAWWGEPAADFPLWDDPQTRRLAVVVDGGIAGMVQYSEEPDPDCRNAEMDIFIDPRHHGRGVGTDTLRTLAAYLLEERGHHRLTIVPAAHNAAAIRSYEKAGFVPVGVTRLSARDPWGKWRDELIMELVVAPPESGDQEGQPSERSATAR